MQHRGLQARLQARQCSSKAELTTVFGKSHTFLAGPSAGGAAVSRRFMAEPAQPHLAQGCNLRTTSGASLRLGGLQPQAPRAAALARTQVIGELQYVVRAARLKVKLQQRPCRQCAHLGKLLRTMAAEDFVTTLCVLNGVLCQSASRHTLPVASD